MSNSFVEFGEPLENQNASSLTIDAAKRAYVAVSEHPDFELVELRRLAEADGVSEILIVNCANDAVPSRNRVGIQYRERLALQFHADPDKLPEVRALRLDFPATPHLNYTRSGEPVSLCLYFEPWSAVTRTWTPQKHLTRILWWLENTAKESLHRPDQPVEQVYFRSQYELVLPTKFDEKIGDKDHALVVEARPLREKSCRVLVSSFIPLSQAADKAQARFSCLALSVSAVVHGRIDNPSTLGELHDSLQARGGSLAPELFAEIRRLASGKGLPKSKVAHTLLILRVPIVREPGAAPERTDIKGFILHAGLGELGVKGGVLFELNGRYSSFEVLRQDSQHASDDWRDLAIEPLEIIHPFTRAFARKANGIETKGPNGILAGAGALGSAIANLWQRAGWGTWTMIDPDHVKPHNLARHTAFEFQIGKYKADIVKELEGNIFPNEGPVGKAIPKRADNFVDQEVVEALDAANFIVDATTTLEFPRDLSARDSAKRAVSVFLTPSGLGCAMLLEDETRILRLDSLEAQYYRAIINRPWGDNHLAGNRGHLWVGAGCRDVSAVIPNDLIQLHAATLARQVRLRSEQKMAIIQVWHGDPDSGTVVTDVISTALPLVHYLDNLKLIWDESLRAKMREWRAERLPSETGGVLLGYFDLKLGNIYVVDALPAPPDSRGDPSGFTRGTAGLQDLVENVRTRTAGVVSYIGEWHSHPPKVAANPSVDDFYLLAHLAGALHADGLPAVMLIVGDHEEKWLTGEMLLAGGN